MESIDKKKKIMKEVCETAGEGELYDLLEKIYTHISEHPNEERESRNENVKQIVKDSSKGEEM